jgi:hypothetical protein
MKIPAALISDNQEFTVPQMAKKWIQTETVHA